MNRQWNKSVLVSALTVRSSDGNRVALFCIRSVWSSMIESIYSLFETIESVFPHRLDIREEKNVIDHQWKKFNSFSVKSTIQFNEGDESTLDLFFLESAMNMNLLNIFHQIEMKSRRDIVSISSSSSHCNHFLQIVAFELCQSSTNLSPSLESVCYLSLHLHTQYGKAYSTLWFLLQSIYGGFSLNWPRLDSSLLCWLPPSATTKYENSNQSMLS